MARTNSMKALTRFKLMLTQNIDNWRWESISRAAEIELKEEQLRQQELGNLIAMLSNPVACPFPGEDVRDRIKELANVARAER